jgi:hypothetical protein
MCLQVVTRNGPSENHVQQVQTHSMRSHKLVRSQFVIADLLRWPLRFEIAVELASVAASTTDARIAATRADAIPIVSDATNSRAKPVAVCSRFQGGNDLVPLSIAHHAALMIGHRID